MRIQNTRGKKLAQLRPFISRVEGNVNGVNAGGIVGFVDGDSQGVNAGGFVGFVEGNVNGVNAGGIVGLVGRNSYGLNTGGFAGGIARDSYGVNAGGFVGFVEGNVNGVNAGGIVGSVIGKIEDYKLKNALPSFITKHLPKYIQEIDLPSVNIGLFTLSGRIRNSVALGLVNYVREGTEDNDYIALGLLNIVKKENGKHSFRVLYDGRITLDGVLSHREKTTEQSIQGEPTQ